MFEGIFSSLLTARERTGLKNDRLKNANLLRQKQFRHVDQLQVTAACQQHLSATWLLLPTFMETTLRQTAAVQRKAKRLKNCCRKPL